MCSRLNGIIQVKQIHGLVVHFSCTGTGTAERFVHEHGDGTILSVFARNADYGKKRIIVVLLFFGQLIFATGLNVVLQLLVIRFLKHLNHQKKLLKHYF